MHQPYIVVNMENADTCKFHPGCTYINKWPPTFNIVELSEFNTVTHACSPGEMLILYGLDINKDDLNAAYI